MQIKSENFKNWFGDWENNPSKASKVVNEDGTPKIVYHGTTSNFTTFDTQRFNTRENSGDYVGEGFFFTDKESTAKKYGSSVMPVYLNLRNPLIINTENDGKKFITSFIFHVKSIPAALYKALGGFATNGINITKLESYLVGGKFVSAQFYVEIEAHPAEKSYQNAFDELNFFADAVKVLGTYPAHPYRNL